METFNGKHRSWASSLGVGGALVPRSRAWELQITLGLLIHSPGLVAVGRDVGIKRYIGYNGNCMVNRIYLDAVVR